MFMFSDGRGGNVLGSGNGGNDRYDELHTIDHHDDEEIGYDVREESWRSGQTFVSVS